MSIKEVIFIGLAGPTHNYGGLAFGNVASQAHARETSNPKEAALQTLSLASLLRARGIAVAILPPHPRPHLEMLKNLGFGGTVEEQITAAAAGNIALLSSLSSSAFMWVANAATIAPAIDAEDATLHLTPANLHSNLHRSIEAGQNHHILTQIFADAKVHNPLPPQGTFDDEGAANHLRITPAHDQKGLHVFVFDRSEKKDLPKPKRFPARQTLEASERVAMNHRLPKEQILFLQQHPDIIDKGVFHDDVIAVNNENVLLLHEAAFVGGDGDIEKIKTAYNRLHPDAPLYIRVVAEHTLSINEAVRTYFFNSQIVTLPEGGMLLIAPAEVEESADAKALTEVLLNDADCPINEVVYLDLKQSMHNGGGPACLRLRCVMDEVQIDDINGRMSLFLDEALEGTLTEWINTHYREVLNPTDIADPALYHESQAALKALEKITKLSIVS
jgi:succinylarginine dihydrolase